MHEIKNLLFQPLTLHRLDGTGVHLGPRERQILPDTAISPEMRQAARRGQVSLRPVHDTTAEPVSDAPAPATRKGGK